MPVATRETENHTETTTQNTSSKAGQITIADSVVAKIVGIAAREVPGVHSLGDAGLTGTLADFASRVTRADTRATGVTVEVGLKEVAADVKITVHYGVNIPQVAEAARRNIGNRVHSMTGLTVKEVNLQVLDLYFPEDDKPAPEPVRRVQ